jgi:hypothetical protein
MNNSENPRSTLTDHLDSSIERVHQNLEAVSFWAHAISGFAKPIPAYVPEECVGQFQAHLFTAAPKEHAREHRRRRQARSQN